MRQDQAVGRHQTDRRLVAGGFDAEDQAH
jgi:hypothetical protein